MLRKVKELRECPFIDTVLERSDANDFTLTSPLPFQRLFFGRETAGAVWPSRVDTVVPRVIRVLMTDASTSGSHRWAEELIDVLQRGIGDQHRARERGQPRVTTSVLRYIGRRYQFWVNRGLEAFPSRGQGANSSEYNLLPWLHAYREDILCFLSHVRLAATNNQAEGDHRMMKLHQKISGCFRSWSSAQSFVRIRFYLSTARKQGVRFLTAIRAALDGHPFIPAFQ